MPNNPIILCVIHHNHNPLECNFALRVSTDIGHRHVFRIVCENSFASVSMHVEAHICALAFLGAGRVCLLCCVSGL
jgi:hypothetical protein